MLEKKKDYQQRAKNYHQKEDTINSLLALNEELMYLLTLMLLNFAALLPQYCLLLTDFQQ